MMDENLLAPDNTDDDIAADTALRPVELSDFSGQSDIVSSLKICLEAAQGRAEPVDHILFSGPPGLGKTTLAGIVAREMQYSFVQIMAPAISKIGDLVSILAGMADGTVLFIDEIHRLNKVAAEVLYTAMEDRKIHISVGETEARAITLDLAPFTLVGATTRTGLLPAPLVDRFGIHLRLDYYEIDDLVRVVLRDAAAFGMKEEAGAWREIAIRARGTPRIAKRLLRRVRDVAATEGADAISPALVGSALRRFGVDDIGLDSLDRRYLNMIARSFRGGPVGIETIAAALSENRDILESSVEPYLLSRGLVDRTPRGRVVTAAGMEAIGLGGTGTPRAAPPLLAAAG